MATTNWESATSFQSMYPHTFNALQHLVMAMADFQKNRHKRPFFGSDRALSAYKRFHAKLGDTLLVMRLDGMLRHDATATDYREHLIDFISRFAEAFPNWQDAYSFAFEYLIERADEAETEIAELLRSR